MDEEERSPDSKHVRFEVAGSTVSESRVTGRDEASDRRKTGSRTGLTRNACNRCRQKKSKCNGKRSTCARCERDSAECIYSVPEEGLTRMQNVQQQLQSKTNEHTKMTALLSALQHESDFNASALLARLRLGVGIDDLFDSLGGLRGEGEGDGDGGLSLLSLDSPYRFHVQTSPWFGYEGPPSPIDEGGWTS